jgi:hypothetical protein
LHLASLETLQEITVRVEQDKCLTLCDMASLDQRFMGSKVAQKKA